MVIVFYDKHWWQAYFFQNEKTINEQTLAKTPGFSLSNFSYNCNFFVNNVVFSYYFLAKEKKKDFSLTFNDLMIVLIKNQLVSIASTLFQSEEGHFSSAISLYLLLWFQAI